MSSHWSSPGCFGCLPHRWEGYILVAVSGYKIDVESLYISNKQLYLSLKSAIKPPTNSSPGTCVETPLFPDGPFSSVPQPGSSLSLHPLCHCHSAAVCPQQTGRGRLQNHEQNGESGKTRFSCRHHLHTSLPLCKEKSSKKYRLKMLPFDIVQHTFYQDLRKDLSIITTIQYFAYNFFSK